MNAFSTLTSSWGCTQAVAASKTPAGSRHEPLRYGLDIDLRSGSLPQGHPRRSGLVAAGWPDGLASPVPDNPALRVLRAVRHKIAQLPSDGAGVIASSGPLSYWRGSHAISTGFVALVRSAVGSSPQVSAVVSRGGHKKAYVDVCISCQNCYQRCRHKCGSVPKAPHIAFGPISDHYILVPEGGVEPPRPCGQRCLSSIEGHSRSLAEIRCNTKIGSGSVRRSAGVRQSPP